jgi:DNA-binding beta-propeller fold protein YncE
LYAIGDCQQIRIISIKPDEDLHAEIQAEPDSSAYYVDDWGTIPTWTPSTAPDPDEIPDDVTGIDLKARYLVQTDKSTVYALDVGFLKPSTNAPDHCEIWYRSTSAQKLWAGNAYGLASTSNGEFDHPTGVCSDGTYIYVADQSNSRIVKLAAEDMAFVANIGSIGNGNGQFNQPMGITTDGTHIWVADTGNHRIQKLTVAGAYVAKLGSSGSGADQFSFPTGASVSGSYVYVCDHYNNRIVKVDAALTGSGGGTWTTIGTAGSGNDQFATPMGIYADGTNVWVADYGNHRIHKRLCSDLSYVAKLGSYGSGTNQFSSPTGIAVDATGGHVWVADAGNWRVVQLDTSFTWESTFGSISYVNPPHQDEFMQLYGIYWYGGDLFLCDALANRITIRDDEGEAVGRAFIFSGETTGSSYRIQPITVGESYEVAVVGKTNRDVGKTVEDSPSETVLISSTSTVPDNVTGLVATPNGSDIYLAWNAINCADFAYYDVRVGASWEIATSIVHAPWAFMTVSNAPSGVTRIYYVKAVSTSGRESVTAASAAGTAGNALPWQTGGWGTNWRT